MTLNDITIMEKPDWISFDDIHELLYIAHAENREKRGFHVQTTEMKGAELEAHIGSTGKCFVALDGEKLVGTASYRIIDSNYWCVKSLVADRILVAVHPDYQGKHIASFLGRAVEKSVIENGIHYIVSTTAEANKPMRNACRKEGFRYIDFKVPHSDHYNVVMLKWLIDCPYPRWRTYAHFAYTRFRKKLKYKPGRIKRFGK
jgi:GNAT superfamily N-acetyltransferase